MQPHDPVTLIGAGIAGLATAVALRARGALDAPLQVLDQASALEEVGAGIQLGPNAVRRLRAWGLGPALAAVACEPHAVRARSAWTGEVLATLPLGEAFAKRYGAPYCTVHRGDLHALLAQAARGHGVELRTRCRVAGLRQQDHQVLIDVEGASPISSPWVAGCDGLWSRVRSSVLGATGARPSPTPTGHVALRALLARDEVPPSVEADGVTVWMGPRLHVVGYPVQAGATYNLVAFVHGTSQQIDEASEAQRSAWDCAAPAHWMAEHLPAMAAPLRNLLGVAENWRLWVLHDRPPMDGPGCHGSGRVALLGDAAHPMRPYLAQGAAMALEDADALAQAMAASADTTGRVDPITAVRQFGVARWARNARVQAQARRNGRLFHATGLMRWGRDAALRVAGPHLMDSPWLYAG